LDPAQASKAAQGSSDSNDGPEALISRSRTLVARLITRAPDSLSLQREAELLPRLLADLKGTHKVVASAAKAAGERPAGEVVERLELIVRILAVLFTKTPGALDRLTQTLPQVEEVDDSVAVGKASIAKAAVPFEELATVLIEIAIASKPVAAVEVEEESGPLSRLRGNLALLFGDLCEAQVAEGASSALRNLDLTPLVEPYILAMRRERGSVQNNIGVLVTKLAQSTRYKQKVRDNSGMESLHQIQLPRVQAQKAEAERQHRLETSESAQQTAALKVRQQRQALRVGGMD